MNVRVLFFCLLSLFVVFGCFPSGDNQNTRRSPESIDVDRDFHELKANLLDGPLNPITCGRELLKKIERIPQPDERRYYLERFGDLILSTELGNGTYRERYLHLGVLEELHFLVANSNCGLPLDKRLEFRLAFLERIRREIAHPLPRPERDRHPPGLFITEERVSQEPEGFLRPPSPLAGGDLQPACGPGASAGRLCAAPREDRGRHRTTHPHGRGDPTRPAPASTGGRHAVEPSGGTFPASP